MGLEARVSRLIARRSGVVTLRSELAHLGSASQLSRVLSKLVRQKTLVRVGHGIYAKMRFNKFTQEPAPAATFEAIALEAFRKLGIAVLPGELMREYNEGRTTQIPMTPIVDTGCRRISRRIQVGTKSICYERSRRRQRGGSD
ncbi:DUF6088 family protein [Paraburkholderia bryophila]|uniref:AbiEi antitoxin of type IV toxin-antitoxin system n=1 Tax=Paraburkholderia bryophila TaxID=420952 RepID=A0A7Y9WE95_9BURK|nr:DUF6088 family protein [Paraburkholderia bryophila]NYH18780.1 hypothetical protein [Paraburkholderia bryophila]